MINKTDYRRIEQMQGLTDILIQHYKINNMDLTKTDSFHYLEMISFNLSSLKLELVRQNEIKS